MRTVLTWNVYYGDRFLSDGERCSFTKKRKFLETRCTDWTNERITAYIEDLRECKIGITSNLPNRKNNLYYKENTRVHQVVKFTGTYAQALMVESYLRLAIEQKFPYQVRHQGNDHFRCTNVNIMKSITRHFNDWVNEGIEFAKAERV